MYKHSDSNSNDTVTSPITRKSSQWPVATVEPERRWLAEELIMLPDSPGSNFANMAIWIFKVHAPPTSFPLHRAQHLHLLCLEPGFPRLYIRPLPNAQAEMLLEAVDLAFRLGWLVAIRLE